MGYITLNEFSKLKLPQYTPIAIKREFLDKYTDFVAGQEQAFHATHFYYVGGVFWYGGCFKFERDFRQNRPHILIPSDSQDKHPCPEMLNVECIKVIED